MSGSAEHIEERVALPSATCVTVPLQFCSRMAISSGAQPVSFGVPLPKGQLVEPIGASLAEPLDGDDRIQTQPLAYWSDGSVKWLLVDLIAPALPVGTTEVALRLEGLDPSHPTTEPNESDSRMRVHKTSRDVLTVETGTFSFDIDCKKLLPFREIRKQGRRLVGSTASETVLVDRHGQRRVPIIESIEVASTGSVRTTLLITGSFARCRGLRFVCRLSFYSGTGLVQIRFTIHNSNRSRHRGGLWDLGDAGSILFEDLSLTLRCGGRPKSVRWSISPDEADRLLDGGPLTIYQDSSGGDNWQSRNHVNRDNHVPCRFRGYQATFAEKQLTGNRAEPTCVVEGEATCLGVSMPEFWQQFPKAVEIDDEVHVRLFPRQWDDLFELQGGEQKTHTVWVRFGDDAREVMSSLQWTHGPARVFAKAGWNVDSRAIPHLSPSHCDLDERLQKYVQEVLHGEEGLLVKREAIDEFGWRNYGDIWADHEQSYYDGTKPVISHYNNQFDIIYGAIVQLMRSGDAAWFDVFEPLARHVIDIDVYHTAEDRAAYNGGLFWITDHYMDTATATHRTYSSANRRADNKPYGGGPSTEHNYATGLLYYYFLTGDPAAHETVLGLARWVVAMDDGSRTFLGVVDRSPTGKASFCGRFDYHGPGRGAANSIQVLLDAWELSRDTVWLTKAEELIRRCCHPHDDVESRRLLDVEARWSYTMFLSALDRYLDLKAEGHVIDDMYAYAQQALIRYVGWMIDNEQSYFDHPEQLEYPTEAWAAQEFRKANVFLLASRHVDGTTRQTMLERFHTFHERAWKDLLRFETKHTARAIALVMKEGAISAYGNSTELLPAIVVDSPSGFGPVEEFEPQRMRVVRHMRSFRGLCKIAIRLMSPSRWSIYLRRRQDQQRLYREPILHRNKYDASGDH